MADYDSDSSGVEDIATNVLLGYASKEPTSDELSQLGGHPTWLDAKSVPFGALAKCKVCNGLLNLLLQLNGDLPDRFPGHERRLYVCACRRKGCRRKEGSIRGFRATRVDKELATAAAAKRATTGVATSSENSKPAVDLGSTLFGVKSPSTAQANPFATSASSGATANPFASASSLAAKPPETPAETESLPETFAQKVRISSPSSHTSANATPPPSQESWPEQTAFPMPYASSHIDADTEYLEFEPQVVPSNARLDRSAGNGEGSSSASDDKAAFESSMDKTFQRFADRLAQNPEQILRYEFDGQPLLYSKTDAVGKLLAPAQELANAKVRVASSSNRTSFASQMRRCANCGAARVFELQLTPHAIAELEADEMSIEGMDWGTIIFGACSADCHERGKAEDEVGYVEEWVGVQWEELAGKRR